MKTKDDYLKEQLITARLTPIQWQGIMIAMENYKEAHTEQLTLTSVSQRSELLKALNNIIKCCDGNEPAHEQIYHIANDSVKAFNCG